MKQDLKLETTIKDNNDVIINKQLIGNLKGLKLNLEFTKGTLDTDIKSLNLLLSNNKKYISMIDWGLSIVELPKHYDSVYSGIHFNRPYESLLFNINDNEIIMNRELLIDEIINSYLDKINRTSLGNDIYLLFNKPVGIECTTNQNIKNKRRLLLHM